MKVLKNLGLLCLLSVGAQLIASASASQESKGLVAKDKTTRKDQGEDKKEKDAFSFFLKHESKILLSEGLLSDDADEITDNIKELTNLQNEAQKRNVSGPKSWLFKDKLTSYIKQLEKAKENLAKNAERNAQIQALKKEFYVPHNKANQAK